MPNYKGHLLGGLGAFGIVAWATNTVRAPIAVLAEWLSFTLLGSLFPDVDTKSKGRKIFLRALIPVVCYCLLREHYTSAGILVIVTLLAFVLPHRTLFHNVWFILIISIVPIIYACTYAKNIASIVIWDCIFFAAGALSHVILDFGLRRLYYRTFK